MRMDHKNETACAPLARCKWVWVCPSRVYLWIRKTSSTACWKALPWPKPQIFEPRLWCFSVSLAHRTQDGFLGKGGSSGTRKDTSRELARGMGWGLMWGEPDLGKGIGFLHFLCRRRWKWTKEERTDRQTDTHTYTHKKYSRRWWRNRRDKWLKN